MSNKSAGDLGEEEVANLIKCPNCGSKLILLPPNNPLFDVQCERCVFRAQVKTNDSKPKDEIFGAGWGIMEKVMKSGYLIPPLIVNFKWKTNQEIRFYPFVNKYNLKKYKLPETAKRANYWMFNYIGLNKLPFFVLYKKYKTLPLGF